MAKFFAGGFDGALDRPYRLRMGLSNHGVLVLFDSVTEEGELPGDRSEGGGGFAEAGDGFGVRHGGAGRIEVHGLLGGTGGEVAAQLSDERAERDYLPTDLHGIRHLGLSGGGKQCFLLLQGARPGVEGERLADGGVHKRLR
ncbi:hypothetical protein [Kitasatospora sp. NPDC056273]|uniref:hypothetical protein n=1 Tax=Kitasatospora sp. NPDC056273 TaxID=3345769 RepID=UPI0035E05884